MAAQEALKLSLDHETQSLVGGLTAHYVKYMAAYDATNAEEQTPGRRDLLTKTWNYMDLENSTSVLERVVRTGQAIIILPPNPTPQEKQLATEFIKEGSNVLLHYQKKFTLLNDPIIPYVTAFVRSNKEAEAFVRHSEFSGIMMTTQPPLWNICNLEGKDCLIRIVNQLIFNPPTNKLRFLPLYNYLHELGHLVWEQHRMVTMRNKSHSLEQFIESFERIKNNNSILWESAAEEFTQMSDKMKFYQGYIYPQGVAYAYRNLLQRPLPIIWDALVQLTYSWMNSILESSDFNHFESVPVMFPRQGPDINHEYPYIIAPGSVLVAAFLEELKTLYQQEVDPSFSWSRLFTEYIENDPTVDRVYELPPRMREFYQRKNRFLFQQVLSSTVHI